MIKKSAGYHVAQALHHMYEATGLLDEEFGNFPDSLDKAYESLEGALNDLYGCEVHICTSCGGILPVGKEYGIEGKEDDGWYCECCRRSFEITMEP